MSPLDWGIGHATRCVPLIRELQKQQARIIIGASGRSSDFLSYYFPEIELINVPGHEIKYPSSGRMVWKMASQLPGFLSNIRQEQRLLEQIIKKYKIDAVISDNRFGMWSKEVYSVYVTHQLRIKAPEGWNFAEGILSALHMQYIRNYNECWIPDYPGGENLSGDLGHPPKLSPNFHYIGPLSRFSLNGEEIKRSDEEEPSGMLILLSGPEPQRSIFEGLVLKELANHREMKVTILRGLPGNQDKISPMPHVTMYSHLPDNEMKSQIRAAKVIICRPGYSTLMDLAALGKGAILVPTPGQTEQEYLARYHAEGKSYISMRQSEFSLAKAIEAGNGLMLQSYSINPEKLLEERIQKIFDIF